MGGREAGEVASAIVVESVTDALREGLPTSEAIAQSRQAVVTAVEGGMGAHGMGSTVVVLRLQGKDYEISWVGDSRAYLWNGALHQLTRDHTFAQQLVDAGVISEQDAQRHPHRHRLTRVLESSATVAADVETVQGELEPGDQILMCSDGLSSEVDDETMTTILAREELDTQAKVEALIEAALKAGGKDNITAVLVDAPTVSPADETQRPRRRTVLLFALLCVVGLAGWYVLNQ
jgi:protein phosphatase